MCLVVASRAAAAASPTLPPDASTAARAVDPRLSSIEASIFGESALVDRETGRIFWEGGSSSTLSESLGPQLLKHGVVHAKATILSTVLWFVLYGLISTWLRSKLDRSDQIQSLQSNVMAAIPIALLKWTLLGVPRLDSWILALVVLLYLTEAYFSSTHQYLCNRKESHDVETYIEQLREEAPEVTWKVRAFHYVPSLWIQPQKLVQSFRSLWKKDSDKDEESSTDRLMSLFPFRRKHVSHRATASFACDGWKDQTTAGVWKKSLVRQKRGATGPPPLAKLSFTQIVVLSDRKAREEYFQQQARFVAEHGRDALAEFATSIELPRFRPRLLAIRKDQHRRPFLFSRRAFWICTLLGLTVFYRVWMASHCDEIRVTVVKETTTGASSSSDRSPFSSWFSSSSSRALPSPKTSDNEAFRTHMQSLNLYQSRNAPSLEANVNTMAAPAVAEEVLVMPPEPITKTSEDSTTPVSAAVAVEPNASLLADTNATNSTPSTSKGENLSDPQEELTSAIEQHQITETASTEGKDGNKESTK